LNQPSDKEILTHRFRPVLLSILVLVCFNL
jgi:hypothetical protein